MGPEFLTRGEKLRYSLHCLSGCNLQDLITNTIICYYASLAERSHSGLVHRSRKPEWSKGHRGFESHPLRHIPFHCSSTLVETMRFQRKTFSCYTLLPGGRSRGREREPLR